MQTSRRGRRARTWRAGLLLLALTGAGPAACGPRSDGLRPTVPSIAPYPQRQLWAVVPPLNESGVSIVDTARVADVLAREVQQVRGLDVLPVNRVLAAQEQAGLTAVLTPADARTLMNLLEVDGLIVGTITAYDPYPPLKLGMAVQLHMRASVAPSADADPARITRITRGEVAPGRLDAIQPVSQSAAVFDARDHRTLLRLQEYAAGRHEPDGAFGPDVYLVSMDLFAQFASYRLVRDLLWQERLRITSVATAR